MAPTTCDSCCWLVGWLVGVFVLKGEKGEREREKEIEKERGEEKKVSIWFFPSHSNPPKRKRKILPPHRQAQLVEAEPHQVHLQLPLRRPQPAHHDALARRHLLVARVDQVRQRLERVGRGEARVAPARRQLHRRVDQDGVDELVDAHVLEHAALVVVRQVGAVGLVELLGRRARRDGVGERAHREELEVDAGAHVGAHAVGENVADGEDLFFAFFVVG